MSQTVKKSLWWVGGGWWLRPILVFSLSLDQAEQYIKSKPPIIPRPVQKVCGGWWVVGGG